MNTVVDTNTLIAPRLMPRVPTTRVVCSIDAEPTDQAAVREACALAGPRGHVALVAVVDVSERGHSRRPALASARATSALERSMRQARAAGVRSSAYVVRTQHRYDALMRAAAGGDVLVIGAPDDALDLAAERALNRATVPVVVARPSGRARICGN